MAPGRGDVHIGSDVWIGAGAAILAGVTIGHGAIIGARAVVTADAPPYSVTVGNPGRVVRLRFSAMQIAGLLQTAWWDLDDTAISELSPAPHEPGCGWADRSGPDASFRRRTQSGPKIVPEGVRNRSSSGAFRGVRANNKLSVRGFEPRRIRRRRIL